MKTVILLLFVSNWALAEEWFCIDQAGKREGDSIVACGIGESTDEGTARHKALKDAHREFEDVCAMSDDCRDKKYNVDPQRTSCVPYNGHWKCHRMIIVTLSQ